MQSKVMLPLPVIIRFERLEFPQGNNSWDKEIKDIHDVYGVY